MCLCARRLLGYNHQNHKSTKRTFFWPLRNTTTPDVATVSHVDGRQVRRRYSLSHVGHPSPSWMVYSCNNITTCSSIQEKFVLIQQGVHKPFQIDTSFLLQQTECSCLVPCQVQLMSQYLVVVLNITKVCAFLQDLLKMKWVKTLGAPLNRELLTLG